MLQLADVFSATGLLAGRIEAYRPRQAQLEMAIAVEAAIEGQQTLIAEAGTGTGKTFAYLVPAVLSGRRVIISTGTKNLQDQLFGKDLPVVRDALAVPFKAALLKGRNNYLCLHRLETASALLRGRTRADSAGIEAVRSWARDTRSGDIAEMVSVEESSALWPAVTSTAENCLGQDCPKFADCFLVKARRRAQEAEILVINHHLLWADWALKSDGFGELLPSAQAVIVDEAHQFAETATQFLGVSVTSRQLNDLARDIVSEQISDAPEQKELARAAEHLEQRVDELRLALGVESLRADWRRLERNAEAVRQLEALRQHLQELAQGLREAAVRGKGLESCWKRCEDLATRLAGFGREDEPATVRWFETFKRSFSLNRTPLEIAEDFGAFQRASRATWIFTSATLSVSDGFEHFSDSLGIADAETRRWESPFDYAQQSLFYLPQNMPDPGSNEFSVAVVRESVPVLKASRGRAFMLFTSHQALRIAAELLPELVDFPLFVQGSQPKASLLDAFRRAGNGILLGTASFWEGVDVRGPALSCVIIDRLPFASPSDPVLTARLEAIRRRGKSPFASFQLPAAVIALKQGVGRLIRANEDRGVLMVCDSRLVDKSYGKVFLRSLPPMRRTRQIEKVIGFFDGESPADSEVSGNREAVS